MNTSTPQATRLEHRQSSRTQKMEYLGNMNRLISTMELLMDLLLEQLEYQVGCMEENVADLDDPPERFPSDE
jgi:hypothetical protein